MNSQEIPLLENQAISVPFRELSQGGLVWVGQIEDPKAVAAPIHEMVMPVRSVSRVDQMTFAEEVSCWETAYTRATLAFRKDGIKGVAVIVNDGVPAGQTVGHVHFHVLGLSDQDLIDRLHLRFNELTNKYSPSPVNPIDSVHIDRFEGGDRLTETLRVARRDVRGDTRLKDIGYSLFSICTNTPQSTAPSLVMEAWLEEQRRPFGLTNLTRVLNGLRDRPYSWPVAHLNQYFAPSR